MIEAPSQITFDEYLSSRDLNNFPQNEFEELENIEAFNPVILAAKDYLKDLQDLEVIEEDRILIAHSIVSHLLTLKKNNEEHLAAFLLPPKTPPKGMKVLIDAMHSTKRTALSFWEALHKERNFNQVKNLAEMIRHNPGRFIRIEGCMFSAKTHLCLDLLNEILTYEINGQKYDEVYTFIFAGLKEEKITTRVTGGTLYERDADPVYFNGLIAKLEGIKPRRGVAVVMDEYTFGEENVETIEYFAQLIDKLTSAGVTVIMSGLNANCKNQQLAISKVLDRAFNNIKVGFVPKIMCKAYTFDPRTVNEDIGESIDSDTTIRHDVVAGMLDWYFHVLIGREEGAGLVEYQTAPFNANAFQSLHDNDRELHDKLDAIPDERRKEAFEKRKLNPKKNTEG